MLHRCNVLQLMQSTQSTKSATLILTSNKTFWAQWSIDCATFVVNLTDCMFALCRILKTSRRKEFSRQRGWSENWMVEPVHFARMSSSRAVPPLPSAEIVVVVKIVKQRGGCHWMVFAGVTWNLSGSLLVHSLHEFCAFCFHEHVDCPACKCKRVTRVLKDDVVPW